MLRDSLRADLLEVQQERFRELEAKILEKALSAFPQAFVLFAFGFGDQCGKPGFGEYVWWLHVGAVLGGIKWV